MANQFNRLNYVTGKGGFLRLIFKPSALSETATLVVLPNKAYTWENDPRLENMTEADSLGNYYAPTVYDNIIRVDLRRRQDPMSLDALGIRAMSLIDRVVIDIGTTGKCHVIDHMAVGPYNFNAAQLQNIEEGFALMGGAWVGANIALPAYAQAAGVIPDISAYYVTGGSVPSGL